MTVCLCLSSGWPFYLATEPLPYALLWLNTSLQVRELGNQGPVPTWGLLLLHWAPWNPCPNSPLQGLGQGSPLSPFSERQTAPPRHIPQAKERPGPSSLAGLVDRIRTCRQGHPCVCKLGPPCRGRNWRWDKWGGSWVGRWGQGPVLSGAVVFRDQQSTLRVQEF